MMSSSVTIRFSGRGIGSRGTAAVVLAVLVSCRGSLGTRDASAQMPSDPRPRPLVDTSDAGRPRIRVELDVFHGKASEKARAVRVAHLMEDVMNSEEFRCAVLSFDFGVRRGSPTRRCLAARIHRAIPWTVMATASGDSPTASQCPADHRRPS